MEAIFQRRSVRKFNNEPISDENIKKILKAAMRAPSAGNEQLWEFIVIKNREKMKKMIEFHPYAKMLEESNCAIAVCGDVNKQKFPYDFWIQDCSAATQNLLLEATSLGIGTVWLGVYPIKERVKGIQDLFHLPEHIKPLCVVAMGYPKEEIIPIDTYVQERIHFEEW